MTFIINKEISLGDVPIWRDSSCVAVSVNDVMTPVKDCPGKSNQITGTTSGNLHITVKAFGSDFDSFIRNRGKCSMYDVSWFAMFDKPVDPTVVARKLREYADPYELESPRLQRHKSNGHSSVSLDVIASSPNNTNDNDRENFHASAVTSISTNSSSGSITHLSLNRKLTTTGAKERIVALPSGKKIKHEIVDGQPTILFNDKRLFPPPKNMGITNTIHENGKIITYHNKCIQRCFQQIEDLLIGATRNVCNSNVDDAESLPQVERPG